MQDVLSRQSAVESTGMIMAGTCVARSESLSYWVSVGIKGI